MEVILPEALLAHEVGSDILYNDLPLHDYFDGYRCRRRQ
jgi:hypothetical protein